MCESGPGVLTVTVIALLLTPTCVCRLLFYLSAHFHLIDLSSSLHTPDACLIPRLYPTVVAVLSYLIISPVFSHCSCLVVYLPNLLATAYLIYPPNGLQAYLKFN